MNPAKGTSAGGTRKLFIVGSVNSSLCGKRNFVLNIDIFLKGLMCMRAAWPGIASRLQLLGASVLRPGAERNFKLADSLKITME